MFPPRTPLPASTNKVKVKIKVNTIHPGYVKTDMNAGEGEIDVPDGARTSVALALIDDNGPNGSYRYLDDVLPW